MNNSTGSWFYSCTSSNQFFSRQCLKGTAPNIFHDNLCVSTEKNHTQIETWDKPSELCHHMFTFLELLDLLSNIPHPALSPGERLLGTTFILLSDFQSGAASGKNLLEISKEECEMMVFIFLAPFLLDKIDKILSLKATHSYVPVTIPFPCIFRPSGGVALYCC